ncbi:MAG: methylmalonyl-CoA mutase family protein, partial [Actinobacteria bacterium]|nr:methylmalonyl-CoA mutase family protein [Actinomycetota bacterium]
MDTEEKSARERWEEAYAKSEERDEELSTMSGVPIKPLYTPEDVEGSYEDKLGYPGEYPYTRGIHPNMYRGRIWTIRQFAGFGSAKETNERFHYLLEQGQTGLSVAFDMPTLMGLDSDSDYSLGEVGVEGVAVDSLEDMEQLFEGIPMGEITTSMTINAPAHVLLAMYVVAGEKQGVPPEELAGTNQNDILKEYIAQKEWLFPPEPSMQVFKDMLVYATEHMPKWNTVSISGYHIREAGSTAAQE